MTMSEKTPAPVGAAVALDLDAIEARFAEATADEVLYELWPTLVAEVCSLTESRATVAANLSASLMLAEAEVVTLRAKVAAVEAIHGRTHWCFGGDDPDDLRDNIVFEPNTEWWPCPTFAALATTGEGE